MSKVNDESLFERLIGGSMPTVVLGFTLTGCIWTSAAATAEGPIPELEASRALAIERMEASPDVSDPAFDVYVSPTTIGRAYGRVDPALLTDVALQLAEGERVMLRSRKAITFKQAFQLAVNAARHDGDQTSLARLEKFATLQQDKDLETQIVAARKLAAVSRDTTDRLIVAVEDVTVEDYKRLRNCLQVIDQARLTSDSRALAALASDLDILVPEPFRDNIRKRLDEALASIPEPDAANEKLIQALERLKSASRCQLDVDC